MIFVLVTELSHADRGQTTYVKLTIYTLQKK